MTVKATGADKTVLKALGLSGGIFGACPCSVDVKDGKIVRIRPLHWDDKYDPKTFNAWKIEKNGKTLEPLYQVGSGPLEPRLQEAGLLTQPGQVPPEAGRLGSQGGVEGAQPAEPRQEQVRAHLLGRGRADSSPTRSSASATPTARWPSWCRATVTASARWCTRPTAAPRCCSTSWAASPSRSATPTAGKAGTGAPSTCGARASSA